MNRPRNSVLHLFDPLTSPLRDAPSPDSDKENSPTSSTFFGLIQHHEPPVKLTRRLIDVGDITVQDNSIHLLLTDDNEPDPFDDDENDFSALSWSDATPTPRPQLTTNMPSSTSPRTPFAELPLECDITPVARPKTYRRYPLPPSEPEHVIAPASAILSVINEVTSSGTSFASPSPRSRALPLPHDTSDLNHEIMSAPPQIIVSSADSLGSSVATLNLETPTGTLITEATRPFDNAPPSPPSEKGEDPSQLLPRRRPTIPNTSSHDPNRHSIDLYSSFQLHLQSEETSFDLLNDRISFFAPGGDAESFFSDESFDMAIEEANMEKALEKIKSEEKAAKAKMQSPGASHQPHGTHSGSPSVPNGQLCAPPKPTPDTKASPDGVDSAQKFTPKRLSLGSTPSPKIPSQRRRSSVTPGSPSAIPVFVPPPQVEPSARRTSVYTPRPSVRDAPTKPLPVPALKIVKRAKRFDHEKSSSSGSASSSAPSPVSDPVAPAQPAASTGLTGRRSGSVSSTTSLQIGRGGSGAVRVAGQNRAPASTHSLGTGPQRVPITEGQGGTVGSASVSGTRKATPSVGMIGPKRVPVVAATKVSAAVPAQVRAPVASGLKPPSRYGSGSSLPRPIVTGTSKLPASGSHKVRIGGISEGIEKAGGSLGVRRMVLGGK